MKNNTYTDNEIALMRLYNEKEIIIDLEYHNMLHVHNPDNNLSLNNSNYKSKSNKRKRNK